MSDALKSALTQAESATSNGIFRPSPHPYYGSIGLPNTSSEVPAHAYIVHVLRLRLPSHFSLSGCCTCMAGSASYLISLNAHRVTTGSQRGAHHLIQYTFSQFRSQLRSYRLGFMCPPSTPRLCESMPHSPCLDSSLTRRLAVHLAHMAVQQSYSADHLIETHQTQKVSSK